MSQPNPSDPNETQHLLRTIPDEANPASPFLEADQFLFGPTLTFSPPGVPPSRSASGSAGSPLLTMCGRFQIDREIARGAMGIVYRAWDGMCGRWVAVKVLLPAHIHQPELRRRLIGEGRIAARLQHPGMVPVFSAGSLADGRPYYAMRLIEGQTLAHALASRVNPRMECTKYLRVFEKICEAMAFAHDAGVIHRDLKTANIMVAEFGVVKVMDWGVAKVLPRSRIIVPQTDSEPTGADPSQPTDTEEQTQHGRILGTPAYMAPEQAAGHIDQLDERTDVFGLGAILCEILTGSPPYTGSDPRSVFNRAFQADLTDTGNRLDECEAEPELIALCKRCLAPDPGDRPRDAGFLSRELTEYLDDDLRRTERDLIRFFELSLDLLCIAGLDGYFRRVNANFSRVLGYPTGDFLNRPFAEFVHPDDRAGTATEMKKLADGEPCIQFVNRYRDIHGAYRWFEWTAKSVPEEGVAFAVARDVTERVRLEDRVRDHEERN